MQVIVRVRTRALAPSHQPPALSLAPDTSTVTRTTHPHKHIFEPAPAAPTAQHLPALDSAIMTQRMRGTTIVAVRHNGQTALGGDGQVTAGDMVMKATAMKVRKMRDGRILAGFAGSVA